MQIWKERKALFYELTNTFFLSLEVAEHTEQNIHLEVD